MADLQAAILALHDVASPDVVGRQGRCRGVAHPDGKGVVPWYEEG